MACKLFICLGMILLMAYMTESLSGSCPLSSQNPSCTPRCEQDYECSSSGGLCCPNLCNTKSCVRAKQDVSYKGSSSSATGTYCGREKCKPNETCKQDRQTNQMKCSRY